MSVSIGWRPDDPKQLKYISGGSSFLAVLETAFNQKEPLPLGEGDIKVLRGIAACGYEGAEELVSIIHENGSIIVEAKW